MSLVDFAQCAVPTALLDDIRAVVQKVRQNPTSVCRSPEAAPILNKYGKHTQKQIYDASPAQRRAWGVLGTPNRPGESTHEMRSDAVAYPGPKGRRLYDWQCGMDWPDSSIPAVMAAFRSIGAIPIHPYASGVEYHHINLARKPKALPYSFLPLKRGSRNGLRVFILSSRLKNCGYLPRRTSKFDASVEAAVRRYQGRHHMKVDGVVGLHTWLNLKATERYCKQHHTVEVH